MSADEKITITCKECGKEFTITKKHLRWFESKNIPVFKRCKACRDKRRGEIKICVDCGKEFRLTEQHKKWLKDRGLKPFKRCKACRDKRKGEIRNE